MEGATVVRLLWDWQVGVDSTDQLAVAAAVIEMGTEQFQDRSTNRLSAVLESCNHIMSFHVVELFATVGLLFCFDSTAYSDVSSACRHANLVLSTSGLYSILVLCGRLGGDHLIG